MVIAGHRHENDVARGAVGLQSARYVTLVSPSVDVGKAWH